jgi:enoyl reductase-like protein
MRENTKQIIQRIGETDQIYLENKTPELALERADLRMQLVVLSQHRQEQIHFLQEAIVLLEQARIEFEEMLMRIYMDLSLNLAKAYMLYFEITHEDKFATITKQILKPITNDEYGDLYFYLAYACAVKNEVSLTQHWLNKYAKTSAFDLELIRNHKAFLSLKNELWFIDLCKSKLN